jgi:type IV pilus assembly protein PilE
VKQDIAMKTSSGRNAAAGFTLVELMITIAVGAILVSIAVPAYTTQIRKTRRPEARSAILDLASREERYFSVNNGYSDKQLDLGYGPAVTQINALSVGSGYYTVAITAVPADVAANTPATYTSSHRPPDRRSRIRTAASSRQWRRARRAQPTPRPPIPPLSAGNDDLAPCWSVRVPCPRARA